MTELPFLSRGRLGDDQGGAQLWHAECETPVRTPCGALGGRCHRGVQLGREGVRGGPGPRKRHLGIIRMEDGDSG